MAAAIRTLEAAKQYLTDEELEAILAPIYDDIPEPPPPPAPPKPRAGTKRYRAEFTIHPDRGPYSISAAADLTPEQVRRFSPWVGETMLLADDRAGVLAEAFDWAQTRENHLSAQGDLRFDLLERADELLALRAGAFDVEGRPIRDSTAGRPQPHVAGPAGRWFEGGEVLSRRFDSTGSCLTVAAYEFLDPIAHKRRKKRHPAFASLAAFYEFTTGKKVREGEPMPMTLRELYKALAKWKVPCRVVDAGNRLVAKYDPETGSARASTLRLAFKNSHCWRVPEAEWKAFDQMVSGKDVATDALPCRDLTASLSPHWRQPAKDPTPTLALVDDAASVLEVLKQARISALDEEIQGPTTIRIACRCEPADLIAALREDQGLPCNLEAASIRAVHGNPDSFALRYGKLNVRVSRAVELQQRTDDQLPVGFDCDTDLENVRRFEAAFAQVRAALCPPAALSTYSPGYRGALETYHRGARCGWLNAAPLEGATYAAFDIGRAYTGFAAEIRQIPVLSAFDDFRPYVAGTPVKPTSSYLVRCASPDGILFDDECRTDHVQGFTVLYARACGIPCEILGVLEPHRLEKCEASAALKGLYSDPDLPDAHRKAIGCIGYGQAVKRFNRQQRGEVFGNKEEALAHGGDVRPIGDSSWLSLKSGKKAMVDGYTPVGAIILDKMRIVLHRMVAAIEDAGVAAAAVRTDCVYVRQEDQERAAAALRAASFTFACDVPPDAPLWDKKVGVVRTELKDGALLPPSPLSTRQATPLVGSVSVEPAPTCTRIALQSETHAGWDKAELDALWPTSAPTEVDQVLAELQGFESKSALAFEGLVPGCGKSFASEDREARFAEGCLTVSPWNRLRCEKGGVTLHKLLGRGVGDADGDRTKPYDLAGVRRVHFEEPYLYSVRELEWMATFMRKHRHLAFTMAGDPGQLRPVNQKLAVDPDAYYEQIFAQLFPRRVTLRYSKRTRTAEEGARMEALCADLRAEDSPVPVILQRHGLRVVDFGSLGEDAAGSPHVAALRTTCDRVNAWAHGVVCATASLSPDEFASGQQLLGRKGGRVQGGRISPNELYTVTRVGERLVLSTQDGGVRSPTLAQARALLGRPYCATGHATQGLSLGDRLFIHDFDSFMADHRWMRTVVSRCSTLDITLVRHTALRAPAVVPQQLARRIALHRDSDKARGFHWDEADYVTPAWAYQELSRQGHRCASCPAELTEDWSIDRITNQRPHTVGNAQIVCRACQHASAHRL